MKKQLGFSLVELMIAMTIGVIILGAVSAVFLNSDRTNRTQDNLARLQENARFALNKMQTDIRMTGYRGCLGRKVAAASIPITPVTNLVSSITYSDDLASSLQGYNATGSGWSPTLNAAISGLSPAPSPKSDIITVRMGVGVGTPLTTTMANPSADIPIAANPDGLAVGQTALIANCDTSTAFRITSITATSIGHAASANVVASLAGPSNQPITSSFKTDAIVMPIATVTYYVAPSRDLINGLSLWRRANNGAAQELADGVETLEILYGQDTNGDLSPDRYVTANNVTNMNDVIAIKLMLLMRTSDDNLSTAGQKYTFNGVANITPADRRIRKSYSAVITIRNRAT